MKYFYTEIPNYVENEILLSKLKCYGIDGNALNWFKNYLIIDTNAQILIVSCHQKKLESVVYIKD